MKTAAIAVAAALASAPAAPALAQDALPEAEVRDFFAGLDQEAMTAVEEGDWGGIQAWLAAHLADEAPIAVEADVLSSTGAAASYEATMTGAQLLMLSEMALGAMGGMIDDALRDFTLTTTVEAVSPLPNGMATAVVRFHESGVLDLRQRRHATKETAPPPMVFDSMATCALRMDREDETLVIRAAACEVETMI